MIARFKGSKSIILNDKRYSCYFTKGIVFSTLQLNHEFAGLGAPFSNSYVKISAI